MAQPVASPNQIDNRTASANLTPPDEQFWQRYSPHAEFPLSSVGSFVIHLLFFGLLALAAWLGVVLFGDARKSVPVEAVRLDLGGGGGNVHGRGEGANEGTPREAGGQENEKSTENAAPEDVHRPELKVEPGPKLDPKFDDNPKRTISAASTSATINGLRERLNNLKFQSGKPSGYGKGGTGEGGGSGGGKGKGTGDGRGDGVATPTQREKRMLRWTMMFSVNNSPDYVAQLGGLGAILAIPVRDGPKGPEYEIVRNLSARPAKLLKEDVQEIQRMVYWVDDKPDSVQGVMAVLGLQQIRPSHFLAFMPVELEKKLLDLEIAYLKKKYPGRGEDDIKSTKFRIRSLGRGKFEPVVDTQTLNRK